MPFEQRYTPVPGMGPSASQSTSSVPGMGEMGNGNGNGGGRGYRDSWGAQGGSNTLDNENFYDGSIPAPHRLSSGYSDPFLSRPSSISNPSARPPPPPSKDSSSSFTAMPMSTAPGAALATQPGLAYQNIPSEQYWATNDPAPLRGFDAIGEAERQRQKRKRGIIIGSIVGAIVLVAVVVGVAVGVTRSRGSGSGSASGNTGNSTSTLSNGGDPSKFDRNDKLHQSFWAMAYTPQGAQPPWCAVSQTNVTRDIQILSQLTTRLRLYGANCNATAAVMQAIQDTKVNMTIWPAIYIDSNDTAYELQLTAVEDALKTYGTDHVEGVIVGNEYILNTATTASLTSAAYLAAVSTITTRISEVKTALAGLNLGKTLQVGTSDAGSILSKTLAEGIDFFMANVHPWFGGVAIDDAAVWTSEFFQEFDVDVAATASNNPDCYIAETGWPTQSMNASEANSGAGSPQGDASVANLQTFLDTFVCQSNKNETKYFFFEAFDEPWKAQYGGVEPYWGLFDSDRNLKNITIPTC